MDNKKILNKLVQEAKDDSNVIGFFLGGSRGKNQETKFSDYDIVIIVKDKVGNIYKKKYKAKKLPLFGFSVFSVSEFKKYAEIGGPFEWDRPSFSHVKTIVDKTGEIQKLINEKSVIPKDKIKDYVAGRLDGYINQVYRSLKCFRDGDNVGARLEASRSVHSFLDIIFAVEGRMTPYYKYLTWELKKYPLKKFSVQSKMIIKDILTILENADIKTQQRLFNVVEKFFRKEKFAYIFDSWEAGAIKLIKTLKQ